MSRHLCLRLLRILLALLVVGAAVALVVGLGAVLLDPPFEPWSDPANSFDDMIGALGIGLAAYAVLMGTPFAVGLALLRRDDPRAGLIATAVGAGLVLAVGTLLIGAAGIVGLGAVVPGVAVGLLVAGGWPARQTT